MLGVGSLGQRLVARRRSVRPELATRMRASRAPARRSEPTGRMLTIVPLIGDFTSKGCSMARSSGRPEASPNLTNCKAALRRTRGSLSPSNESKRAMKIFRSVVLAHDPGNGFADFSSWALR